MLVAGAGAIRRSGAPWTNLTTNNVDTDSDAVVSMPFPPAIERTKGSATQSELRDFVAREIGNRFGERNPFSGLAGQFISTLQGLARQLLELPENDVYWISAPKSQSFMAVLKHYLEVKHGERPHDEAVLWGLAAFHVSGCDNEFGRRYWVPLVERDIRNVSWLVESALWVLLNSGTDTTLDLRRTLEELITKIPSIELQLRQLTEDPTINVARNARIALMVIRGHSLFDAWNSRDQ